MSIVVPKPGEPLVEEDRLPTKPWYNYLTQNANELANVTTVTTADIEAAIDAASTEFKINSGTVAITTGQTEHNFTDLPANITRLTIDFDGVALTSVAETILVKLGTTTAIVSSGYISNSVQFSSVAVFGHISTAGFAITAGSSTAIIRGHMIITRVTSNHWVQSHSASRTSIASCAGGGDVSLVGELGQVRITNSDTANNVFRLGQANIHWEF